MDGLREERDRENNCGGCFRRGERGEVKEFLEKEDFCMHDMMVARFTGKWGFNAYSANRLN